MVAAPSGVREVIALALMLSLVGAGCVAWPHWQARRRASAHRERVDGALAEVADLLLVVLGAGASVSQSIEWVATEGPEVVRPAFGAVVERTRSGRTLVWSLSALVDDLSPSYWPLVTALTAALRDGAPTSGLLLRLGDESRSARRRSAERSARALPVQMLFPLVCCSLPAVVVGAVVPLALVAFAQL